MKETIYQGETPDEAQRADFSEANREIGEKLRAIQRDYKDIISNMRAFSASKHSEYKGANALAGALRDNVKLENIKGTGKRIPDEPINLDLSETKPLEGTAGAINSVDYHLSLLQELEDSLSGDFQKTESNVIPMTAAENEARLESLKKYLEEAKSINWKER